MITVTSRVFTFILSPLCEHHQSYLQAASYYRVNYQVRWLSCFQVGWLSHYQVEWLSRYQVWMVVALPIICEDFERRVSSLSWSWRLSDCGIWVPGCYRICLVVSCRCWRGVTVISTTIRALSRIVLLLYSP